MPDMLVRNIKPETMDFLKRRAAASGKTVQDEVRAVLDRLEAEERQKRDEFWAWADAIRESTRGRPQTDSAELRLIGRRGEDVVDGSVA